MVMYPPAGIPKDMVEPTIGGSDYWANKVRMQYRKTNPEQARQRERILCVCRDARRVRACENVMAGGWVWCVRTRRCCCAKLKAMLCLDLMLGVGGGGWVRVFAAFCCLLPVLVCGCCGRVWYTAVYICVFRTNYEPVHISCTPLGKRF